MTYGHVSVYRHDDEDHMGGGPERVAVKGLSHTLVVGDEAFGRNDVSHQLRQKHCVAHEVVDGEVAKKNVHGLVQLLLTDDEHKESDVRAHQGEVDKQQ